jgi:hypothetical protein
MPELRLSPLQDRADGAEAALHLAAAEVRAVRAALDDYRKAHRVNWQLICGLALLSVPLVAIFAGMSWLYAQMHGWRFVAFLWATTVVLVGCIFGGSVLVSAGTGG